MTSTPTGTFIPLHEVLPDPTEPNWDGPTDLETFHNDRDATVASAAPSDVLLDDERHPSGDLFMSAILNIRTILTDKIDSLNRQGVELFKASNYADAQKKAEQGKALASLKLKAEDLHKDWLVLSSDMTLESTDRLGENLNGIRQRRTAQKLIVRFSDGERILENSAAETFSKAIAKIGVAKVESLGIKRLNHPLVSLTPPEKYQSSFADGYYIVTHFGTEDKRRLLMIIADQLGVSLQAELID